jgi:hypothetical protein
MKAVKRLSSRVNFVRAVHNSTSAGIGPSILNPLKYSAVIVPFASQDKPSQLHSSSLSKPTNPAVPVLLKIGKILKTLVHALAVNQCRQSNSLSVIGQQQLEQRLIQGVKPFTESVWLDRVMELMYLTISSTHGVGATVGARVGRRVGVFVGLFEGAFVGPFVRAFVGAYVGPFVGPFVLAHGDLVGATNGAPTGAAIGVVTGDASGATMGAAEGGPTTGAAAGATGAATGVPAGALIGDNVGVLVRVSITLTLTDDSSILVSRRALPLPWC